MDKKLHVNFSVEGEDVDKINWFDWLNSLPNAAEMTITGGDSKVYYTTSPEKDSSGNPKKK